MLKTVTYNIATSIGEEEGYARECFVKWSANERSPAVIKNLRFIIGKHHPHIINIQEARSFTTTFGTKVNSLMPVAKALVDSGYNVLISPYNAVRGNECFKYITAYDPEIFVLSQEGVSMRYFTKTPDKPTYRPKDVEKSKDARRKNIELIKEHNFGVLWERGMMITPLEHIATKQKVYSINVHFDVPFRTRIESTKILMKTVKGIRLNYSDAHILVAGDFNCIPKLGGDEQLSIIKNTTFGGKKILHDCTEKLELPNGTPINATFFAFVYDFTEDANRLNFVHNLDNMSAEDRKRVIINTYEYECYAIGAKLDRVFACGLRVSKSIMYPAVAVDDNPNDYTEKGIKDFTVNSARKGMPSFASDHQPVIVYLYNTELDNFKTKNDIANNSTQISHKSSKPVLRRGLSTFRS